MSIQIIVPSYLKSFTSDNETIEVEGSTVSDCLNHLVEQFPDMQKMLFADDSSLHPYVSIYINGEDAYPNELTKPTKSADEIHVMYIIGGG